MSEWRVYVCAPPKSGKNGRNFLLSAQENGREWKRRSARTADKSEAEQAAREWLAEILRTVAPLEADPTVGQVLERHMLMTAEDPDIEDSTRVTYRTAMRRLVPVLGDTRASQLDRPRVLAALQDLRAGRGTPSGKPLKGTTLRLTLRRARDAWAWAQERGWVTRPWPKLKQRDMKWGRTKKRPYTDSEVTAVLSWVAAERPAWLGFFALMAATGMRSSEVCGLRGRDVLRAELEVRFSDAKSKESTGAPVPADVMALLPDVAQGEPVFSGPKGGRATPHAANEVKLAAVRALGLPDADQLDVHSFKRSWVDGLHRASVDLATAMRAARHKTAGVHIDYQRNARGHDVRAAQERVLEQRRAAGPLTGALTQDGPKSLQGTPLAGLPSNPAPKAQGAPQRDVASAAPHWDGRRKSARGASTERRPGEGWDGLEDPLGEEIARAVARMSIEATAALAFDEARIEVLRDRVRERRPDLVRPEPHGFRENQRRY